MNIPVDPRGKSGPFLRQRPAPLLREPWAQLCIGEKEDQFACVCSVGDARMMMRDVQTMPRLEGREDKEEDKEGVKTLGRIIDTIRRSAVPVVTVPRDAFHLGDITKKSG